MKDAEPHRPASPQPGEAMQPQLHLPAAEPVPSSSPDVIGWDGPLPPRRGSKAVLTAREGHDLIVPSSLADGSDIDAPLCRPLILFCLQPGAIVAIPVALRLTQELHWQRYYVPAEDMVELLRLFTDRDSLGRLHIRITARCITHIVSPLSLMHCGWQDRMLAACCTA